MLGRLFKFLLGLFVLVLIVAIGGWVMVRTTENPLTLRILGQSTDANGAAVIDYELQNLTPFPVELISSTLALKAPGTATPAFVLPPGQAPVRKFTAGETVKGRLSGSTRPKAGDELTLAYDWEPWGQKELRQTYDWMEEHANLVPQTIRTNVYWSTQTRKGVQTSVVVPDPAAAAAAKKSPVVAPAAPSSGALPSPAAPAASIPAPAPSEAAASLNAASSAAAPASAPAPTPAPQVVPPTNSTAPAPGAPAVPVKPNP